MMGALDDDVYYDQMKMLEGVRKSIGSFCTDEKGKPKKVRLQSERVVIQTRA